MIEQKAIDSTWLNRIVIVDFYLPKNISQPDKLSLLLINDGQNLEEMKLGLMLNQMIESRQVTPLLCVGIHAGKDRKNEYGTAGITDYLGRGTRAEEYHQFILEELIPFIHAEYSIASFSQKAFAGFSLGGLTALDMTWHYPDIFSVAGVFSGSLWWRTRGLDNGYNEDTDRIMHQMIRKDKFKPGLRFYFTTGSLDETADRNQNGIIDSIDDTLSLIEELKILGYDPEEHIRYINYEDGHHDIATWGRSMPAFLMWGWGRAETSKQELRA
ncbi:MAG: alpha/beta hydrolase [Flavisolibacter sp.]